MVKGNLGRLAFVIGLVAAAGAAGCYLSEEEVSNADDEVVAGADVSGVLKSTLLLEQGCIATKVGPHHLLVAARCVAEKPEFAPGKKISFKVASAPNAVVARNTEVVVGADAGPSNTENDAGADSARDAGAGPATDGGTRPPNTSNKEATISEVQVHASYKAKCPGQTCAFGTTAASDAKDVAVILLDADLETIPTIPVDLDSVGQSDPLLAVGSGCAKLDGTPRGTKTIKTIAVPAKSVNHEGSPYKGEPELATRLNGGYVVTAGIGWRSNELELCKNDIGAPLFRGSHAAVVGVTSNFTTFDKNTLVPVTVHHTRVDTPSKVGTWLASLGVETTKTCSADGCPTRQYDGGAPSPLGSRTDSTTGPTGPEGDGGDVLKGDGGKNDDDVDNGRLPSRGNEEQLGEGDDGYEQRLNDGEGYDAGPKKKKKKQAAGCSAAPGTTSAPTGGFAFAVGFAIAAAAARRRRR
jgi:MYXO-CTERM domain-containing protein